jgi:hypothetical protein
MREFIVCSHPQNATVKVNIDAQDKYGDTPLVHFIEHIHSK